MIDKELVLKIVSDWLDKVEKFPQLGSMHNSAKHDFTLIAERAGKEVTISTRESNFETTYTNFKNKTALAP